MAKTVGFPQGLWLSGIDLSGDTGSIDTASGGNSPLDVTGIDRSALERLGGKRDSNLEFTSFFNPSAGQTHQTLRQTIFTAALDWHCTWVTGYALGSEAYSEIAKQVDYAPTRGDDGSLTFKTSMPGTGYGAEWGNLLTTGTAGKRTDAGATSPATGFDFNDQGGASTAFGWQAWLHVFALTGTNVVVTLQDSADNSAFTTLTGGAFTSVTAAPAKERLEGGRTATVRRYLRAITTGTFTSATIGVSFTRNLSSVAF